MSGQQHRASRCVFVGNIPYDATEEQLVQICEEVGPVVSFRLVVDRDTGKPKGYGFCEFRDEETALSARRNLQGYEINGRQLRVDFAENEKGGGGVDRNREQGRGGPGYQQNPSHLDVKKEGGGGGHQSGFGGGGGAATLEPPIGRAAASEAALMMANALGGAQQQPNAMMQGQGPMQPMNAAPSPITGNGGVPTANDTLTNHLASMSKHQLYEIMAQMKNMAQQNQLQVRQILVANPQLTKALFQAQIILGMVRPPQVAVSQPPQAQQLPPSQQPGMQQQQQLQPPPPPRPLQPLAPPMQMQQQPNKSNFPPPLPQSQQQPLQQPQALPPQQQQQQPLPPPPHPQGSFQVGMTQTSLGMGFPQGPPPQAPNQPPPQQLYQMGSNMMTGNLPRMGTNSGGGMLSGSGTMGSVQMHRGPAQSGGLGSLDARGVQLPHGLPPSSTAMGGISGVHGQGHIAGGGHSMVSTAGSGTSGLGQSLQNNLAGPQMMGDPNGRGYAGLNPGLAAQMNSAMNSKLNSGLNSGMNAGMNNPHNSGMNLGMNAGMPNLGMNAGMPQGLNQGYNAAMNMGMNQAGLHSNMNPGMNLGLSMGLNASQMGGLNASQGGFSGVTDGTPISTAALQSQGYPQQSQGQASMELDQQKALLQQVLNLTNEQIMLLPPDQRQQVLQLQQALR